MSGVTDPQTVTLDCATTILQFVDRSHEISSLQRGATVHYTRYSCVPEVMFSPESACLSVCLFTGLLEKKLLKQILV